MTTANPQDFGWNQDARGVWRKDLPGETIKSVAEQSTQIRRDSYELLDAQRQNEAEKSANYVKSLLEKQQRIEREKAEKAARLAQAKLDEITADPEVTQGKLSRRFVAPRNDEEKAQLRTLEQEEVEMLKRFKAPHDKAVEQRRLDYEKNYLRQKNYGDDAARENLLRLIAGFTPEQRKQYKQFMKETE
ncbi:hypothetical protein IQ230_09730 [Gloeocapsopsis crepidinum LEGE 06123]|uniref:Uncharacterized protein n=1 Tax=Gloeocapsopsis crepidinum LEGE 06123 TaxID=588587 RepID=A0ABR9UQS2_9CHRO|nr:hypothetical protein [Gloeocapsopsis crepidinum]MBE9190636.1 hypothetical protein [Gloeocapsopsis crepidinum LEGE 06123]